MNIIPLSDHVLEDVIMPFESYMFITTRRFIEKHDNIPSHTLSVFVRGQRNKFLLDDLSSRKEGLSFFNQNMKAVTGVNSTSKCKFT